MSSELSPFEQYLPTLWKPEGDRLGDGEIYSVLREHGVEGTIVFHNLNDDINQSKMLLDQVLLEYRIREHSYAIFTVSDLFKANYTFSESGKGNIMGDLAERVARRVTKFFLKHHSSDGHTGGIFDKRFNPKDKNGYVITNNDRYILKIQDYPNMIILKKSEDSPLEYDGIKELDGFFDYRYNGERHILVLESKLDRLNINVERLVTNLFDPLKELLPDTTFHYILFSQSHSLFRGDNPYRVLRTRPYEIYERLSHEGVGTLFFSFNESQHIYEKCANHLITQYKLISHQSIDISGRIVLERNTIHLYNNGEHPFMSLRRDMNSGMWRDGHL